MTSKKKQIDIERDEEYQNGFEDGCDVTDKVWEKLLVNLLGRIEYNKIMSKKLLDDMAEKYMVKRRK